MGTRIKHYLLIASILLLLCGFAKAAVTYAIPLGGEELQMGNLLKWSTSSELNSALFLIEKSTDGINFFQIGNEISALGNPNEGSTYSFLDIDATDEKSLYRLKEIDEDGAMSFSQTIIVKKLLPNFFKVVAYSSIHTDKVFEVTLDALKDGKLKYELLTYKDELVLEEDMLVFNGLNQLSIDMENFREGVYKVKLTLGEETEQLNIHKNPDLFLKKTNVATNLKLDKD